MHGTSGNVSQDCAIGQAAASLSFLARNLALLGNERVPLGWHLPFTGKLQGVSLGVFPKLVLVGPNPFLDAIAVFVASRNGEHLDLILKGDLC